jgi:membrane protein
VGGILAGALVISAVVLFAALEALFPEVRGSAALYQAGTYAGLLLVGMAAAGVLYRYAPNGAEPRWQWVTPGSAFAALGWLALTFGFGFYVENFGNYDATYGSLSAVIVLLTWIYVAAYVLLLGAEINAVARERAQDKA